MDWNISFIHTFYMSEVYHYISIECSHAVAYILAQNYEATIDKINPASLYISFELN